MQRYPSSSKDIFSWSVHSNLKWLESTQEFSFYKFITGRKPADFFETQILSSETALGRSEIEQPLPFSASLLPPSLQSLFAPPSSIPEVGVESDKASLIEKFCNPLYNLGLPGM